MDGMARSGNTQDRVVQGGGRETASSGEGDAHPMEDAGTHGREDRYAMFGTIPEAA